MPLADSLKIQLPERLEALRAVCLLDTPIEPAFDRLTRLASTMLHAPVALVTLVDGNRQFFKSQLGLSEPWSVSRQTPLTHSFCQHVVADNRPLVIEDARLHPLVHDNPAIIDLKVIAYAGIPLVASTGHAIGSFCVIDNQPRQWTKDEINMLSELTGSVMTEIELRAEIRERNQMEIALRASEEQYRSVVSSIYEGVVLQNRYGEIITCNASAERILGLTRDQMMGRTSLDPRWRSVHEDGSDFPGEFHPAMIALKTGNQQRNIVMGVYKPNDQLTWILINSEPLFEADDPIAIATVTTFIDITERKLHEEQALATAFERERNKLLSEFINKSSHEFRTPLSIIHTSMYLMNTTNDPAKRSLKSQTILEQVERIALLVDKLHWISRLDNAQSNSFDVIEVNDLIDVMVTKFRKKNSRTLQIRVDLQHALPQVMGDSENLLVAIWELVENAINTTPDNGYIVISTAQEENYVLIIIQDYGAGISKQALPHIFERLYRVDSAHSSPGLGLGLPIAQSIITGHSGKISITSEERKGTTVVIHLPVSPLTYLS